MNQGPTNKPRRLLMISTDRKIFEEGSAVRARQIEYARDWDEVHIVVFQRQIEAPGNNFKIQFAQNCFVYPTNTSSVFFYAWDAIRLGREIIEEHGITNITCQDTSVTAMAGVSLKKRFDLPLELQMHEDIGSPHYTFTTSNRIRKKLSLRYIPQADHIRVVSERIRKYLVDELKVNPAKIEIRPIKVDVDRIKNAPVTADLHRKYPQFNKIVLMAGRLESEKNFKLAIEAWPLVLKSIPNAGLIIVGEGRERDSLEALAKDLHAEQSIAFESWADPATLASYYKTCDLFLNTSLFEGYGMALAEAKAAGCRIVSTDVGIAQEIGAEIADWTAEGAARGIVKALGV